jgi:hypothetical protein
MYTDCTFAIADVINLANQELNLRPLDPGDQVFVVWIRVELRAEAVLPGLGVLDAGPAPAFLADRVDAEEVNELVFEEGKASFFLARVGSGLIFVGLGSGSGFMLRAWFLRA